MRQIGSLPNEADSTRFVAFLITKGIAASADEEKDAWEIWVRDEDQIDDARAEFEQFKVDPSASKYQGVEHEAQRILRDEIQQREAARRNVVEMRGKWAHGGATQKKKLTMTLVVICVAATLVTRFANERTGLGANVYRGMTFSQPTILIDSGWRHDENRDPFAEIKNGQVWRTITPIFLHGSWLHLIFNMFWMVYFGMQIETRHGPGRLLGMVLVIAVFSNVVEALMPGSWNASANGIGISGVVFGLFGYVWVRMVYSPAEGLYVSPFIVIYKLAYVGLGLTGGLNSMSASGAQIDHWAHGLGLLAGVVIAYFVELRKRA